MAIIDSKEWGDFAMKFNVMAIVKAVLDTSKHSKEYEAQYREITKEPLCGYNKDESVRALIDPKDGRFVKIQIKADAAKDREIVDILEEATAAVNDALNRYDKLWADIAPDSIKKLESEFSEPCKGEKS
jgi:DNA-binding protein YbaB